MDNPIITSLLDNDFYQLKMSYSFWKTNQHKTIVSFKLHNRSDIKFNYIVSELNDHITELFNLKFSFYDLSYIKQILPIDLNIETYLDYLMALKPPTIKITSDLNDNVILTYTGEIGYSIFYETPILAIIKELYIRYKIKDIKNDVEHDLSIKLNNKIDIIKNMVEIPDIIEFGTRRRFSKNWQDIVFNRLYSKHISKKTSNIKLAQSYNIHPVGSVAHLWDMFHVAKSEINTTELNDNIIFIMQRNYEKGIASWNTIWGNEPYITDTFGTEYFLNNIFPLYPNLNVRQDSGDPFKMIDMYNKSFNNKNHILLSDGLTINIIKDIKNKYYNQPLSFGWGTNLTDDSCVNSLQIVIKLDAIHINNTIYQTVKLSDNPEKSLTSNSSLLNIYKNAFPN